MLKDQIDTFLFELMGKRFSAHSHLVSAAYYISNKVYGIIRPLQALPAYEEVREAIRIMAKQNA
ncbi:hypothetical protein SMGES_04330 [Serratia marcescens]|nr:hypothetical protein SMGES_04330 [Serratia marcescens]